MKKQTAVQIAIEKIDKQIEIAQVSIVEASKVKDNTSTERHHGKKIALVFMRQELVNLLEMEKQQLEDCFMKTHQTGRFECLFVAEENWITFESWYKETFKSE